MSLNNDFSVGADNALACIFALSGTGITDAERALFKSSNPLGFILFKRNIDNPDQVGALVRDLKDLVGRDCPVLIDQEGGRVQRLRSPHWREYSPMKKFGDLYRSSPDEALEALRFETLRLTQELVEIGVNVDCAPVLDIIIQGAHDIVGDRSFSDDPDIVSRLGLSVCRHFISSGITPIIKHIPGHGRANCDSHKALPIVDAALSALRAVDFAPFRALADMPMAMTAHIVYSAIDADHCATVSSKVVDEIRSEIGFNNLLMTDDLSMHALEGSFEERTQQSLAAGCDVVLHCNGKMDEMQAIVAVLDKAPQGTVDKMQSMWKLLG